MAAFFSCVLAAVVAVILCIHRGCFAIADDGNSSVRPGSDSPVICDPTIEDHQQFYSKETVEGHIEDYWIEFQDHSKHERFWHSPPINERKKLSFRFPFYGQVIKHIYVTKQGVVSMSPDIDKVPVSHFIYPFFHPNMSEDSAVYFHNSDDKFIVEWRNVFLKIDNETTWGPYQYQTIVHRNGTILFLYKKVPSDYKHPLAGLGSGIDIISTGCIFTYNLRGAWYTLYAMLSNLDVDAIHSVIGYVIYQDVLVDANQFRNGAVVKFTPLSNCELARDSQTCVSDRFSFYCKKCELMKYCSEETDKRLRQWLRSNCKHETPDNCKTAQRKSSSKTVAIVVIIAVVVVLISLLGGWTFYAYKHPNTPSGRWLIEHRPSQWLGLYRSWKGSSTGDQDRTSQEAEVDDDPGY